MANGYGGSSSTLITTAKRKTNNQGQTAPAGYHYMPDGTLMSDAEHAELYGKKVIRNFNLDTNDIKGTGEKRKFEIIGDNGAVFSLEIKNGNNYYNFQTNLFQATKTRLSNITIGTNSYAGNITFPSTTTKDTVNGAVTSGIKVVMDTIVTSTMEVGDRVTGNTALDAGNVTVAVLNPDGDNTSEFSLSEAIAIADGETLSFVGANQYDVFLFCESNYNTKHAEYVEVRANDSSIDINSSTGSNSNLVQKVIYQTLDTTITLSFFAPNNLVTGTGVSQTITTSRNRSVSKIPFSLTYTVSSTRTLTTNKQPTSYDIMAFVEATIGSAPINIPGEDIYPAVSNTDTVNGARDETAVAVTMDSAVATKMAVGDRVTGNTALDAGVFTVASLDSTNVFSISTAVEIADGITLSFSNRKNYRWPIYSTAFDVSKLVSGMHVTSGNSSFGDQGAQIAGYLEQITVLEGEIGEYKVDKIRIPALDTLSQTPITLRDEITKVATTTVGSSTTPVNATFSNQALLSLAGDGVKIYTYGAPEIKRLWGYDLQFSDLVITLKEVKTTPTSAVSNSTSIPIANRTGIMDGISGISGIGIDTTIVGTDTVNGAISSATKIVMDADVANTMSVGDKVTGTEIDVVKTVTVAALNPDGDNVKEFSVSEAITVSDGVTLSFSNQKNTTPTVVSGAGSVAGAGTIVLSAAQTLESGIELTFPGASSIATITGNIKVNKAGNEDVALRFDLEKLLTMH